MYIKIKSNKARIPVGLFIGLIVSTLFYFLLIKTDDEVPWYYYKPVYLMLFIYAASFTMLSIINYFRSVFYSNACLTISDNEIIENLTIFSVGQIPWSDVSGAEIKKVFNTDMLVVKVKKPEKYSKDKNLIRRYIIRQSLKKWQSPIVINSKSINFDLSELRTIIMENSAKQ